MSLLDLYYNSNKDLKTIPYSGVSKLTVDTSRLNLDSIPSKYSVNPKTSGGQLYHLNDTSKYNIDIIPKKYHG